MNQQLETPNDLGNSPVFVTGAPKVGKSVLLEVFYHLNDFHVIDEPLSTWRIGMHGNADDCRNERDATNDEVTRIQTEIRRSLQENGKKRYADLLSHHALQLPYLRRIYPNARVVIVTRDPRNFIPEAVYFWTLKPSLRRTLRNRWRNVKLTALPAQARRFFVNVWSNRRAGRLNTWGAIVPGQAEFAASHTVAELAAYQWATLYRIALDAAQQWSEAVSFVKFEDLKHRPRETVESLFRFCQIEPTTEVLDFAANYFDPNFVMEESTEVPKSDWDRVWPLVAEVAGDLGYELPSNE